MKLELFEYALRVIGVGVCDKPPVRDGRKYVLHGIGHESRAPNPNTSKYGVGIGGKFIQIIELIRITIFFFRTVKDFYTWQSTGSIFSAA